MKRSPKRSASGGIDALVGIAADPHALAEVVARLVLQRHARADDGVAVDGVDAVEPVADPAAAGLEHDHLQPRERVEHAVVEQRRELVADAVGGGDRREQPELADVLPGAEAAARLHHCGWNVGWMANGTSRSWARREHRVVVGVAERLRPSWVNGATNAPRGALAHRALELLGRRGRDR